MHMMRHILTHIHTFVSHLTYPYIYTSLYACINIQVNVRQGLGALLLGAEGQRAVHIPVKVIIMTHSHLFHTHIFMRMYLRQL